MLMMLPSWPVEGQQKLMLLMLPSWPKGPADADDAPLLAP